MSINNILYQPIHNYNIEYISDQIRNQVWSATFVMKEIIEQAKKVHLQTNCIITTLYDEAINQAFQLDLRIKSGEIFLKDDYPLLGIPISIKDNIDIKGITTTSGFLFKKGNKALNDSNLIQFLKLLGGIPFCKTNICQLGLTTESSNLILGTTLNPFNQKYSPGGSSSGEGPLIALGGSILGFGTDIGGSLRYPASWNGIYTIKPTAGIFSLKGIFQFEPGQDFIKSTIGPMTNKLEDLIYVFNIMISKGMYQLDSKCIQLDKNLLNYNLKKKKLRFGTILTNKDYVLPPAIKRSIQYCIEALKLQGHEIIPIDLDFFNYHFIACKILSGNLQNNSRNLLINEGYHSTIQHLEKLYNLSYIIRYCLPKFYQWKGELLMSKLCELLLPLNSKELFEYQNLAEFEFLKLMKQWETLNLDFILSPVSLFPSHLHGNFKNCGPHTCFSISLNLLNLPSAVLPVTKVNATLDSINLDEFLLKNYGKNPKLGKFSLKQLYSTYDANDMHGLPIGVQLVAKRFEDVKVLKGLEVLEYCLNSWKKNKK